jgi:hypothetical protein
MKLGACIAMDDEGDDERRVGKNLEGTGRGVIEILSQYLPGGPTEYKCRVLPLDWAVRVETWYAAQRVVVLPRYSAISVKCHVQNVMRGHNWENLTIEGRIILELMPQSEV